MSERRRPRAPWFARATLGAVLVALYGPLLVLVMGAFIDRTEDQFSWTLRWFREVLADETMWDALGNSLLVAATSSALATLIGTAAAIALHRGPFRGRKLLQGLSFISLVLPEIVFALALLSWFFVLRLTLGLNTVVCAHVTFSLSYVILTVGARLATMDPALEDAARDLGASEGRILWKVVVPLLKPSLLAAFLLSFLLSFDDFLITFFVNGVGSDTLPIKLYTSMKMGLTPKLNALASLMWLGSAFLILIAFRTTAFRDVLKTDE